MVLWLGYVLQLIVLGARFFVVWLLCFTVFDLLLGFVALGLDCCDFDLLFALMWVVFTLG